MKDKENKINNKKLLIIIVIAITLFTILGGTFAYWMWISADDQRTGVAFTVEKSFSCSADGGQNINSTNIQLIPTADCTNQDYALQRTIKVTPDIKRDGLTISLDMWLKVNSLGEHLSDSDNLKYALTTNPSSCTTDVVAQGNFKGLTTNGQVNLLNGKEYVGRNLPADTYYLYIWLDAKETDNNTQNQNFDFSLGGECTDHPEPEAPVLDTGGMIPVTISDNGTVRTVSADDPNWYDYEKKEWANIVLVNENKTDGVDGSHPRSYYLANLSKNEIVAEEDILAYYVWIPRYKYKISNNYYCSDVSNINRDDYPDCYLSEKKLEISETQLILRVEDFVNDNADTFCSDNCDWETGVCECTDAEVESSTNSIVSAILTDGVYSNMMIGELTLESFATEEDYVYEYSVLPNKFIVGGPTTIDITFEKEDDSMVLGNATTQYRTHPAFWWDDNNNNILDDGEMLSGLWFGKFENSSNGILTVLPDKVSVYGYEFISENYGLTSVDGHNFKFRDWGAVAYLSHSIYGINREIKINDLSWAEDLEQTIIITSTGGGGSTTGNITGVYDMSGGNPEVPNIVFGLNSKNTKYADAFNVDIPGDIDDPDNDYGLRFDSMTVCNGSPCYGYALYETQSWYDDSFRFGAYPLLWGGDNYIYLGGAYCSIPQSTAGAFSVNFDNEPMGTNVCFETYTQRSVIVNKIP